MTQTEPSQASPFGDWRKIVRYALIFIAIPLGSFMLGSGITAILFPGGIPLSQQLANQTQRIDHMEETASETAQQLVLLSARLQELEPWSQKVRENIEIIHELEGTQRAQQTTIDQLHAALTTLEQIPTTQGDMSGRLLETRMQALEDKLAAGRSTKGSGISESAGPQLNNLQDKISETDKRLAQITASLRLEAAETDRKIQDVSTVENAATLVVVSYSLIGDIEAGHPFGPDLAAMKALQVDPSELALLEPFAEKGVASPKLLGDLFAQKAIPILAGESPEEIGGLWDKILRGISQFVKVRPIGPGRGIGTPDLVARISDSLTKGDVRQALAAYDQLPSPAKSIAQSWAARARVYVTVSDAAHELLASALMKLGKSRL